MTLLQQASSEAGRSSLSRAKLSVAVAIPCYNEAVSVTAVVEAFRKYLPQAEIYVYDNNSTDDTAALAAQAGANVRTERQQGKGNVVRRMFADIDADIIVIADGDNTYDAASAPALVDRLISDQLDMIVATRLESSDGAVFRSGHRFGNRALTTTVNRLFGSDMADILSGYRVAVSYTHLTLPTKA